MVKDRTAWGRTGGFGRRLAAGLAGAALVIGIPSAGLAFGLLDDGAGLISDNGLAAFTPASADPRVARMVAERGGGKARFMRFTPAGTSDRGSRSVTVAVRVDEEVARAISVRSAIEAVDEARVAAKTGLRIAPTRYNLGLARGYQSFAKPAPGLALAQSGSAALSQAKIPDLAEFRPSAGVRDEPARFAARVQFDDGDVAGPATPTMEARRDHTLDVAGSYRLSRNLDVTAGVRYSQDRDRLAAHPDLEEQDSQAVYIGTQFRF